MSNIRLRMFRVHVADFGSVALPCRSAPVNR